MLFGWIRSQVRAAVLAGVGDALQELDAGTDAGTADAVTSLRTRLQALPAPSGDVEPAEVNGKRRKSA